MLRSLYVMLDYHLAATDGEMGKASDFLFDDESWVVHYLVAEAAGPKGMRKALVLPFAVGQPDWEMRRLPVLLTSEQIRSGPPPESDLPISQQRESGQKRPGSHLRSFREILGYSIYTTDGEAGVIEDFIVEATLWGVHHVVVTLKQHPRRSILLSPESIRSISWPGKAAWVNMSLDELEQCPDFDPATPVNRDEEHRLYDYYGRPIFPLPAVAARSRGLKRGPNRRRTAARRQRRKSHP